MSQPSLADLILKSGYSLDNTLILNRAFLALYGEVGANLDERNWDTIMSSANPLQAAESALVTMYHDAGYLLRNVTHLASEGYGAAQAEMTYRQLYKILGVDYSASWSVGTPYEYLGHMTDAQVEAQSIAEGTIPTPSAPVLGYDAATVWATTGGGNISLSVTGSLGSFGAGDTTLTQQSSIKEGYLTVTNSSGLASAATAQYVVLGTSGVDNIDTSGAGSRKNFIFGGDGNDVIHTGTGDDVVSGGAGNDTITGGGGNDIFIGGAGNDTFIADAGSVTIKDLTTGDIMLVSAGASATASNISSFVATALTSNAGTVIINAASAGSTIDVSLAGGTAGYTLNGSSGIDTLTGSTLADNINGGGGNDVIIGKGGADILTGGGGVNEFRFAAGESTFANVATITDYRANGADTINLASIVTVASNINTVQDLSGVGSLAACLNIFANAAVTSNGLGIFIWGGSTYVYVESVGSTNTYTAGDTVIKLTGTPFAAGTSIVGLGIDGV
ncbi:calcium-binding protein [Undibacterium terreum]|uniref:Hemolysin-type calcium-binding repeat-containing protein n=1 Tax=Undibacterium terreum TaxID=1224302 RepID=A0A916UC75_9BURK|nr:calcium-binding protein [Undibacterium terreum]GGC65710.1 hypothetical protein GCM10011396_10910 [Undibacterium terreum]